MRYQKYVIAFLSAAYNCNCGSCVRQYIYTMWFIILSFCATEVLYYMLHHKCSLWLSLFLCHRNACTRSYFNDAIVSDTDLICYELCRNYFSIPLTQRMFQSDAIQGSHENVLCTIWLLIAAKLAINTRIQCDYGKINLIQWIRQ